MKGRTKDDDVQEHGAEEDNGLKREKLTRG
jgi:hypothetical protein